MKNKIALIGICSLALLFNMGCSSTKSTQKNTSAPAGDGKTTATSTTGNAVADNNAALPPVAEAPRRQAWGGNIGLYGY